MRRAKVRRRSLVVVPIVVATLGALPLGGWFGCKLLRLMFPTMPESVLVIAVVYAVMAMVQVAVASICVSLAEHTEPESILRVQITVLQEAGSRFRMACGVASVLWAVSIWKSGATHLRAWFSGINLVFAVLSLALLTVIVVFIVRVLLLIRSYWNTDYGTDRVEVRLPF